MDNGSGFTSQKDLYLENKILDYKLDSIDSRFREIESYLSKPYERDFSELSTNFSSINYHLETLDPCQIPDQLFLDISHIYNNLNKYLLSCISDNSEFKDPLGEGDMGNAIRHSSIISAMGYYRKMAIACYYIQKGCQVLKRNLDNIYNSKFDLNNLFLEPEHAQLKDYFINFYKPDLGLKREIFEEMLDVLNKSSLTNLEITYIKYFWIVTAPLNKISLEILEEEDFGDALLSHSVRQKNHRLNTSNDSNAEGSFLDNEEETEISDFEFLTNILNLDIHNIRYSNLGLSNVEIYKMQEANIKAYQSGQTMPHPEVETKFKVIYDIKTGKRTYKRIVEP
jgi:hypothetical protein